MESCLDPPHCPSRVRLFFCIRTVARLRRGDHQLPHRLTNALFGTRTGLRHTRHHIMSMPASQHGTNRVKVARRHLNDPLLPIFQLLSVLEREPR